jgi:poly-gamma-glutamate synthesis protein (capsule biosynthesis protein)
MRLFFSILLIAIVVTACAPAPNLFGPTPLPPTPRPPTFTPAPTSTPTETPLPTQPQPGTSQPTSAAPAATPTSHTDVVWTGSAVPSALLNQLQASGVTLTSDPAAATVGLDVVETGGSQWIYALVAPFPTVTDDVTIADLRAAWTGVQAGPFAGLPLRMSESTRAAFMAIWGEPGQGSVLTEAPERLLDSAWAARPSWALIPFEDIEPRWKVLSIDGQSPLHKDFDANAYPLKVNFAFTPSDVHSSAFILSPSNRDPAKLTTVILTGVTALVRATAKTMDVKGITYPGQDYREIFRQADILHINNEVPFYGGCPDPNPAQEGLVFCSATRYIELLTDIGTDVVELSGDHFANYGTEAMDETLAIYKKANFKIYGGGATLAEGKAPLLLTVNGTKLMFIGCNIKSIYATATDTRPGAVTCDFPYMHEQIAKYRAEGYLPIATFQYHEYSSPEARPQQVFDFRGQAEAGAVIVSGSQAHQPQVMEFYNGAFIHYGLGNLFFDQMGEKPTDVTPTRREFIDRHVFYDGKYLGVELLTALLEDYARPRPMTLEERVKMLTDFFGFSGW